jgi:hypothetical protein
VLVEQVELQAEWLQVLGQAEWLQVLVVGQVEWLQAPLVQSWGFRMWAARMRRH